MKNKNRYLKTLVCLTLAISLVLPPSLFAQPSDPDHLRVTQIKDNPNNPILGGLEEDLRRSNQTENVSSESLTQPLSGSSFWAVRGQGESQEFFPVESEKADETMLISGPLGDLLLQWAYSPQVADEWNLTKRTEVVGLLIGQNVHSFGDLVSLYRFYNELPKPGPKSQAPKGGVVDVPGIVLGQLRNGFWQGNEKHSNSLIQLATDRSRSREARISQVNILLSGLNQNQINHLLDLYVEHPENEWGRFSRNFDFSIAELIQEKIKPLGSLQKGKTIVRREHFDGSPYLLPKYTSARKTYWRNLFSDVSFSAGAVFFLVEFPILLELMSWGFEQLVLAIVEATGNVAREPRQLRLDLNFPGGAEGYVLFGGKASFLTAAFAWLYYDATVSYPDRDVMLLARGAESGSPPYEVARVTVQELIVEVRRRMDLQPKDGFEQEATIGVVGQSSQKRKLLSRPDFSAAVANAVASYAEEQRGRSPLTYPLNTAFDPRAKVSLEVPVDPPSPSQIARMKLLALLAEQSGSVAGAGSSKGANAERSSKANDSKETKTPVSDLLPDNFPLQLLSEAGLELFAKMIAEELFGRSAVSSLDRRALSGEEILAAQKNIIEIFYHALSIDRARMKDKIGKASRSSADDLLENSSRYLIRYGEREYEARKNLIPAADLNFLDLHDPSSGNLVLRIMYDVAPSVGSKLAQINVISVFRDAQEVNPRLVKDLLLWIASDLRPVFSKGLRVNLLDAGALSDPVIAGVNGLVGKTDNQNLHVLPVSEKTIEQRVGVVPSVISNKVIRDIFGPNQITELGSETTIRGLNGQPIVLQNAFRVEIGSADARIPVYFVERMSENIGGVIVEEEMAMGSATPDGIVILMDRAMETVADMMRQIARFSGAPVTLEQRLLEEAYPNRDLNNPDFIRLLTRDLLEETVLHEADHYLRIRQNRLGEVSWEEFSAYLAPVRFGSNPTAQLYFFLKSSPAGDPHRMVVRSIKQVSLPGELSPEISERFSHPAYPSFWIAVAAQPVQVVLNAVGKIYSGNPLANSSEQMELAKIQPFVEPEDIARLSRAGQEEAVTVTQTGPILITTATALRGELDKFPRVTIPSAVTDPQRVLIVTPDGLPKLLVAAAFVSQDPERPLLFEALANDAAHQKRVQAGLEELGLRGVRVHDVQAEFGGNVGEAITQLQMGHWQEGKETLVVTALSGLEEITRFLGVPGVESELRGFEAIIDRSQAVWS